MGNKFLQEIVSEHAGDELGEIRRIDDKGTVDSANTHRAINASRHNLVNGCSGSPEKLPNLGPLIPLGCLESTDFSGQQSGETNRRSILKVRSHDLDAHRQTAFA
jgi:hypothetical protein